MEPCSEDVRRAILKTMAFFKKSMKKINGLWYPQAVTVGKPATTKEVAVRIARESTVSPADVRAVIESLAGVMGDFMAEGRTVHLEGFGTFYYTCIAAGQGVATEAEVSARQITGVRVRFIPEARKQSGNSQMTRSLVADNIGFVEWRGKEESTPGGNEGEGEDPSV